MQGDYRGFFPPSAISVWMWQKNEGRDATTTSAQKTSGIKKIIIVIYPNWEVISCLGTAPVIKTDCCVTEYIFQKRGDYIALCHNI